MKNVLDIINKKSVKISIILFVILIFVYIFFIKDILLKNKLIRDIEKMGKAYYETTFYDNFGKNEELLISLSDSGVTLSLENLLRESTYYNKEDFKNGRDYCNFGDSKITLYPIYPYKNKDIEIKVTLICGF